MGSYFASRRTALGILASIPIMSNASILFKNKVESRVIDSPLFIDFLLSNIPYSNSHSAIGLFVVQHTEISKIVLNKLTELQQSLHTPFTQRNTELLNNDLEQIIKNDFLTFKTLTLNGLVISETEALLWSLQYVN